PVVIASERPHQLVGLKSADHTDEQVVDFKLTADAFNAEGIAIPCLQPELIILPAGVALHVGEHPRKLVENPSYALWPSVQKLTQALDRPVRDVGPGSNELARVLGLLWHVGRGSAGLDRVLD